MLCWRERRERGGRGGKGGKGGKGVDGWVERGGGRGIWGVERKLKMYDELGGPGGERYKALVRSGDNITLIHYT